MKKSILYILFLFLISKAAYSTNTDIIVLRSHYDYSQKQYQKFNGSITLMNTGNDSIKQFNITNVYFSKDSILDTDDIYGGYVNFSVLPPHDSITLLVAGGANQFGINADSAY